ncbi:MAG: thiol peroxidase [Gammaproteobacteria bacterium]|nr:thiol peroxidase [Gammaproteobacteria bacterium]
MAIVNYENATYRTFGELPAVGSRAPDVSLVNAKLQNVSLANWTGMRKVMNIFVSIDTEVCAKSVIEFDSLSQGVKDVAMLMISYDLPFAHERFQKQHDLQNVVGLSAIRHAGFGENYGVLIVDGPLAGMFARAVVVLDENNTVVYQEHIDDIATEPNYRAALRALGISADAD